MMKKIKNIKREKLVEQTTLSDNDIDFRFFLNDFLSYARYLEETRAIFANVVGITASQHMILTTIQKFAQDKAPGINDIAAQLHYSSAFVTIEVNQLVKNNLITKIQNPNDLRRVLLDITDEGYALLEELAELQRPVNDVLFGSLTEDSFQQLRKIINNLTKDGEKALRYANYINQKI